MWQTPFNNDKPNENLLITKVSPLFFILRTNLLNLNWSEIMFLGTPISFRRKLLFGLTANKLSLFTANTFL